MKAASTIGNKKKCIVIAGPTAVGKTALAVQLATELNTRIISADSRQCFKELNIGVARPTEQELKLVPHYFIASHSIHQDVNAAIFEAYALEKLQEIFKDNDSAIVVGGTGLYIKALCEGMDEVPEIDTATREAIIANYNRYGLDWLQQQVKQNDEAYFATGEIANPQRMMRALEVKLSTNRSILDYQTGHKKQRPFEIIKIGVELPREMLIDRINRRVTMMMEEGLVNEVESLLPYRKLNAMQTVGYKEILAYLDGELTLPQATEAIKISTRQYAKRQMTWFKKDAEILWCKPELEQVLSKIKERL